MSAYDVRIPLLAAAAALELDRDAACSGESADYRRGMTWAIEVLRLLADEEKTTARAAAAVTPQPEPAASLPQLAVPCPSCGSSAGQLCTSHSGTRVRRHNTHTARTRAYNSTKGASA